MAVVSYDDYDLFRLYTPTITVIAQPVEHIAKHVIDILLEELECRTDNLPLPMQHVVLPASLIVRQSSTKQAAVVSETPAKGKPRALEPKKQPAK